MKTTLRTELTVADVCNGFVYNQLEGKGLFGTPTGAPVFLRGASHAEWGPWGLRRDYVLFDEVHVWKQILLHQG